MSDTLPPPEKPMADITKQLASALRLYLSAYQAMDQAAAIRAADRAAHESLAALASQPAARVALTWDQFVAACEAEYGEDFAPEEFVDVPEDQKEELMRVVRMVERAHGISEYALAALAQRQPLTDEQIRREKPVCADFVSFRAGVRCAERMHEVSK